MAMFGLEVIVCWGFMVLVWLCIIVIYRTFGGVCDVCCGKGVVVVAWCW